MSTHQGKMTFGIAWCFVVTALASVAAAIYGRYGSIDFSGQALFILWCSIALLLSSFAFAFLPRSAYERPKLLLFTWWIVPFTTMWIGFKHTLSENSNSPTMGIFLMAASAAAMFLPVVFGGIARSRLPCTKEG